MATSAKRALRSSPLRNVSSGVATIDAIFAETAYHLLVDSGVDGDAVLVEAGLKRELFNEQDARIPFRLHVKFLELAAQHSRDECFGLHCGATMDAKNVGVLGYVAMSSATIADAIIHVQRYYRIMTSGEIFEAHRMDEKLILEFRVVDLGVQHSRQNDDMALMSALRLMQIGSGLSLSPDWVESRYTEPVESNEFRRLFNTHVRFGSSLNALVFPETILGLPIHTADNQLLHILEAYCQSVLRERGDDRDLLQQVSEIAMRMMPNGSPKVDAVAGELAMSPRTLSRRLQEYGMTYREIISEVRTGLAKRYLEDNNLRLSEIAYLLGYADISAFNHAFNRWTGISPSRYRTAASET